MAGRVSWQVRLSLDAAQPRVLASPQGSRADLTGPVTRLARTLVRDLSRAQLVIWIGDVAGRHCFFEES